MKFALIAAIAAVALSAPAAQAATAIYTVKGTADGSLNGVGFSGAGFTFTLHGDTDNITYPGSVQQLDPLDSASVVIDGFSAVTLGIPTSLSRISDGTLTTLKGVINGNLRNLLIWTTATPVDFAHSFGPVGSGLVEVIGNTFATSGGDLKFNLVTSFDGERPITFSAVVRGDMGVPEPATWGMMVAGFGGMGALLRRRRMAVARI